VTIQNRVDDGRSATGPLDRLVLGVLGVWRVTHLLQAEDGPWDLVVHLRRRAGPGFWGGLLDCFHCLSLWTGAIYASAIGRNNRERVMLWPALSAGAVLLERITTPPAAYIEDRGDEHVLWEPEAAIPRD
jgi:hypothetical protein